MTRFLSILRSTDQLVLFLVVFAVGLSRAPTAVAAEDDLYDVLGVDKSASTHEIRNAYKSLAKEWHPDKNSDPAANEKFMKINEAYETLSNDEMRSQYDNHGTTSAQAGQEQHRSDNEFAGASFNFGGFTFTFSGKTFDHFGQKYRLTHRLYEDVVLPGSQRKPYVVFIYSDYCDDCSQIEDTWETLLQDLVKSDIGIGTISYDSEKSLVKKLRIRQSPSVIGVVEGQLRWFSGSFELQSLRDFTRRLFPSDLIQEVNNATNDVFLNSWKIDNKVRVLFFDLRKVPPLRLVAAAFAYRSYVTVGYVNMARLECDYLITNYQLNRNQENLLIFKEDSLNPIIKIAAPEIKRHDINEAIEGNRFLILPRISSPMMFYDYCLPVSPLTSRRLCVILLSKKTPQHDVYRESFREYAGRHAQERVKFGYVYEETQGPLVRLMTWGNGAVNDTHGTLKVAILWHKEPKTVHYDMLETGWHSAGSELQRSRRKLKQVIDWLLLTGDVMPYTMKLRSEVIDEHAQNIWIRVVMRLHSWIYRFWDKVLSIDEILLLTVVTTAILVVVIGVVVRVLVMTEDANVQRKMAPKEKGEKSRLQNASLNVQPVADSRPTVHIYPLCCENYDELVLQGGNEIQLVVILVDEASRAKLLQYFAWILLPYLKSKPYKVAFLQLEEYLPWFRSLLEATMGLLDSSEEARCNLSHINMKNCLGTVIAINSRKKFYHMYHYSTTKPRNSEYLDDDLSSDECVQALRSDANKLFESDLVRGFGHWMERLGGGKLKKYRVAFWPDMVV